MNGPRSRRSVLRYCGIALSLPLAGCSTLAAGGSSDPVPVFVDNRDDADHEIRIRISATEDPFDAQFSVEAESLVEVTRVDAPDFCLHADVPELDDGELAECPAPDEAAYSASGYAVIIYPGPADDHGSRWLIQPVQNVEPNT